MVLNMHILLLTTLLFKPTSCALLSEVDKLYSDIFTGYNRNFLPTLDQDDVTTISMKFNIMSINNFDEVSGELDLTMVYYMIWTEERLTWDPALYGNKYTLIVDAADIWRPQIYLGQSFGSVQSIGNNSFMPRLYRNGTVVWTPGSVLKVSCTVDVTYFPFDKQSCTITLSGWSYSKREVNFELLSSSLDTSLFGVSTQWILSDETSVEKIKASAAPPSVNINLVLLRQPQFYVIYIIVPLVLLGGVNNLVFLLPDTSGERMSVAITVFLSFIVFLQMIKDNVPKSSYPMAFIYYYVLFLLVYSSFTLFLCIMSLRIHGQRTTVPGNLQSVIRFVRCGFAKRKIAPKQEITFDKKQEAMELNDTNHISKEKTVDLGADNEAEITWKVVGDTYDHVAGIALFFIYFITTFVCFVKMYMNVGL